MSFIDDLFKVFKTIDKYRKNITRYCNTNYFISKTKRTVSKHYSIYYSSINIFDFDEVSDEGCHIKFKKYDWKVTNFDEILEALETIYNCTNNKYLDKIILELYGHN